jgi:hypothetical protein
MAFEILCGPLGPTFLVGKQQPDYLWMNASFETLDKLL